VPYSQVSLLAEARSEGEASSPFGKETPRTAVDAPLTRRLRDAGGEVDVVVVAHLSTKKVSGLVGNKGGVGVAEVNDVVFELSLSSVYRFEEQRHLEVGKSSDSLALAGIDRKGKTGSGQLKGKRNPESDRPAWSAPQAGEDDHRAARAGPPEHRRSPEPPAAEHRHRAQGRAGLDEEAPGEATGAAAPAAS